MVSHFADQLNEKKFKTMLVMPGENGKGSTYCYLFCEKVFYDSSTLNCHLALVHDWLVQNSVIRDQEKFEWIRDPIYETRR